MAEENRSFLRILSAGGQLQKRGILSAGGQLRKWVTLIIFRFSRDKKKINIMRTILSQLNKICYNF